MAFVTDASVAAAWVLPDEDAALAELALDRLGAETAMVPAVFPSSVRPKPTTGRSWRWRAPTA